MKSPTHRNCPSCHTPVALERYERACGAASNYLVCPECDYTFLLSEAERIAVTLTFNRAEVGSEEDAAVELSCLTFG